MPTSNCLSLLGLVVVFVCLQVQTAQGDRVDECLAQMRQQLEGIQVPASIRSFSDEARAFIGPNKSMTEILTGKTNSRHNSFFRRASPSGQLVGDCLQFNAKNVPQLNGIGCFASMRQLPAGQFEQMKSAISEDKALDELIGAVNLCQFVRDHQQGGPRLVPTRR